MAKAKVKEKGGGFEIEGVLNFKDRNIEVEEMTSPFPLDKILKMYDDKYIKLTIKEPDIEIFDVEEFQEVKQN